MPTPLNTLPLETHLPLKRAGGRGLAHGGRGEKIAESAEIVIRATSEGQSETMFDAAPTAKLMTPIPMITTKHAKSCSVAPLGTIAGSEPIDVVIAQKRTSMYLEVVSSK